jgi:hypothetical protein
MAVALQYQEQHSACVSLRSAASRHLLQIINPKDALESRCLLGAVLRWHTGLHPGLRIGRAGVAQGSKSKPRTALNQGMDMLTDVVHVACCLLCCVVM